MKEASCDFANVGKGCKATILASNIDKHKKTAIVKHVDLLSETVATQQTVIEGLESTVKSQSEDIRYLKEELVSLREEIKSINEERKEMDVHPKGKGPELTWNTSVFGKGYTFPKPNSFDLGRGNCYSKIMANYVIKSSVWKSFVWELRISFFLFSLVYWQLFNKTKNRITMSKYSGYSHIGFIRAPWATYVPDFSTSKKYVYDLNENGWGANGLAKGATSIRPYHNNKSLGSEKCSSLKEGVPLLFKVDFDKKEVSFSCGEDHLGVLFSDIPEELIPAMSEAGGGHAGSIRFVKGVKR